MHSTSTLYEYFSLLSFVRNSLGNIKRQLSQFPTNSHPLAINWRKRKPFAFIAIIIKEISIIKKREQKLLPVIDKSCLVFHRSLARENDRLQRRRDARWARRLEKRRASVSAVLRGCISSVYFLSLPPSLFPSRFRCPSQLL